MSRIGIIFVYIFGSCAAGCLLAYPASLIIDAEFDKIVSRGILISAVLLFYPAYKLLNIKSPVYLGFSPHHRSSTVVRGWLIGIVILVPLTVFYLLCGYREWEPLAGSLTAPVLTILLAIISGLVIALIEETLFRGLMQTEFANALPTVLAIVIVNFLYASVHFLEASDIANSQPNWTTGFSVFISAFSPLGQPAAIWDSWLALFTAGIFLSVIRLNTDNLFWCIGIHAGWVAHIKIIKAFTDRNADAPCGTLTGEYDKFIGELSSIWILALLVIWGLFIYRRSKLNR